jgi:hypothetical protein
MAKRGRLGEPGDIKLGKDVLSAIATKGRAAADPPAPEEARAPERPLQRMTVHLYADQVARLKELAFRAALERGRGSPDASALIREAVDTLLRAR